MCAAVIIMDKIEKRPHTDNSRESTKFGSLHGLLKKSSEFFHIVTHSGTGCVRVKTQVIAINAMIGMF